MTRTLPWLPRASPARKHNSLSVAILNLSLRTSPCRRARAYNLEPLLFRGKADEFCCELVVDSGFAGCAECFCTEISVDEIRRGHLQLSRNDSERSLPLVGKQ